MTNRNAPTEAVEPNLGRRNLRQFFDLADHIDRAEGLVAYSRYHQVMRDLADAYDSTLPRTLAAFCALSPNNDYVGNLRSTASVLAGVKDGVDPGDIVVSTYKHCRDRAYQYATGEAQFLGHARGPKIRAFYRNILDPHDWEPVTIDGHMKAAFEGKPLTMKEAIVRSAREYDVIANETRRLANRLGLLPNQLQAIIWFARKRVLRIKFEPQISLFARTDDLWATLVSPSEVPPFPFETRAMEAAQ
ncbi:MAG: hypothetical protein AAGI03_01515 [Pseudomonadota bacterium]